MSSKGIRITGHAVSITLRDWQWQFWWSALDNGAFRRQDLLPGQWYGSNIPRKGKREAPHFRSSHNGTLSNNCGIRRMTKTKQSRYDIWLSIMFILPRYARQSIFSRSSLRLHQKSKICYISSKEFITRAAIFVTPEWYKGRWCHQYSSGSAKAPSDQHIYFFVDEHR